MYAEIKQQPLLACFLCSYNPSSRLCFLTVIFSLLYICIYLYLETPCVHMGSNRSHVQPSNAMGHSALPRHRANLGLLPALVLSHFG